MDELHRQCQALAQRINQEQELGLTSQQIATLVEAICPHLGEVRLTQAGKLRKKDEGRFRSLLADCHLCYQAVVEVGLERAWGLTPEQLRELTSQTLPHARAILHGRLRRATRARLRDLVAHYHCDSELVEQLLPQVDCGPQSPPEEWEKYLQRVSMVEYDYTPIEAEVFVSAVWPHILRCLHRYHYTSPFLTWIYRLLENYREDGQTWAQLQSVPTPVMENLLVTCLEDWTAVSDQPARSLESLGQKAGMPPVVLDIVRLLGSLAGRLFAQDPTRLALQACADIYAGLPGFCFASRLTTWIHQVVLNCRKKVLQELGRDPFPLPGRQDDGECGWVTAEWEPTAPGPGPMDMTADQEMVDLVRTAIQQVCQGMRDRPISRWKKEWIGRLRFVQGEEHKAISQITGVNLNTVMTIIARIKPYLMEAPWLADYLPVLKAAIDRLDLDRAEALAPNVPARPGEALRYRITLTNTGQADANSVTAEIELPPGSGVVERTWASRPHEVVEVRSERAEPVIRWQCALKAGQQLDLVYTLDPTPQQPQVSALVTRAQVRVGRQSVDAVELSTPLATE